MRWKWTPDMNRYLTGPVMLTMLLLAAGCSGILTSDQPAKQYYLLQPLEASTAAPASAGILPDLAVEITAIPGLDTDQILALGVDARLRQYSNARWPDHLPEVLSSTLQRSLESAGGFTSVRRAARAADEGWLLQLEAREFFGILDATGNTLTVRVALAGTIDCDGRRQPLNLRDAKPVASERLAAVVAAHQAGLDGVTRQLLQRIEQNCGTGEVR
jgi:ABC-type uncharacterized transport system auxiliary subunit